MHRTIGFIGVFHHPMYLNVRHSEPSGVPWEYRASILGVQVTPPQLHASEAPSAQVWPDATLTMIQPSER